MKKNVNVHNIKNHIESKNCRKELSRQNWDTVLHKTKVCVARKPCIHENLCRHSLSVTNSLIHMYECTENLKDYK